jgi:SAM-dependent methyltransferase
MSLHDTERDANKQSAGDRLRDAVRSAIARRRPDRLLVISALPAALPGLEDGCARLLARIETAHLTGASSLHCEAGALPFEDQAFDMVIAHHVLVDGSEAEMDEIQRVLGGDGQVIAIGRGRFGMRGDPLRAELPTVDVRALCRNLRRRAFQVRQCEGFGMLGMPAHLSRPWHGSALAFSDTVLIRGSHRVERPVVTPLRFGKPRAAAGHSAAYEGVRRQATS